MVKINTLGFTDIYHSIKEASSDVPPEFTSKKQYFIVAATGEVLSTQQLKDMWNSDQEYDKEKFYIYEEETVSDVDYKWVLRFNGFIPLLKKLRFHSYNTKYKTHYNPNLYIPVTILSTAMISMGVQFISNNWKVSYDTFNTRIIINDSLGNSYSRVADFLFAKFAKEGKLEYNKILISD